MRRQRVVKHHVKPNSSSVPANPSFSFGQVQEAQTTKSFVFGQAQDQTAQPFTFDKAQQDFVNPLHVELRKCDEAIMSATNNQGAASRNIRINPEELLNLYIKKIDILKDLSRIEEAIIVTGQAISYTDNMSSFGYSGVHNTKIEIYTRKIDLLKDLSKLEEAIAAHDEAILYVDKNIRSLSDKNKIFEFYIKRFDLLKDLNRIDDLMTSFDKAYKYAGEGNFNSHQGNREINQCKISVKKAEQLVELNRLNEASNLYRSIIKNQKLFQYISSEEKYNICWSQIDLLEGLNRLEDAEDICNIAIQCNSSQDRLKIYWRKISILKNLNKLDELVKTYDAAIRISPQEPELYYNKIEILLKCGRVEDILALLDTMNSNILDQLEISQHKISSSTFPPLKKWISNYIDTIISRKKQKVAEDDNSTFQISKTKLFPVENNIELGTKNDSIGELVKLLNKGNERLSGHQGDSILLMGDTGAGKTTLAHVLSKNKLQAIINDQTGEILLAAVDPLENMSIGHKQVSETTVPNKCFVEDRNIIIWDCPGFNDTSPVQEIANSYYIKNLIHNSAKVKLIFVADEATIITHRGINFVRALKSFMSSINDIATFAESVSLVITQVQPHKKLEHLNNSINQIISNNPQITEQEKLLLNVVVQNNAVHLLHRPLQEGLYDIEKNLLDLIIERPGYIDAPGNIANIALSSEGAELAKNFLHEMHDNISNLVNIVQQIIVNPEDIESLLSNFYGQLVQPLLSGQVPLVYGVEVREKADNNFLYIKELQELYNLFNQPTELNSVQEGVELLEKALKVIVQFTNNSETVTMLHHYAYALLQQYSHIQFFTEVKTSNSSADINLGWGGNFEASGVIALKKINEIKLESKQILEKNIKFQIENLNLDKTINDSSYYLEAIKYLSHYPENVMCNKKISEAYICLAKIIEESNSNEAINESADINDNTKKQDKIIEYYVKAISHNKDVPEIYTNLGKMFIKQANYSKAIECYKVVNDAYNVNECFKAWINIDRENPEIWLQRADYASFVGMKQKAVKYYNYANSFSNNEEFKKMVMHKIADSLRNDNIAASKYDIDAQTDNFYAFYMVDKEFIANLSGASSDFQDSTD